MKRLPKIATRIFTLWLLIQIGDGLLTQYQAVQVGRELCHSFIHGYPNAHEYDRPPGVYRDLDYRVFSAFEAVAERRQIAIEDNTYDACRFQFKWRWKDGPFAGVLHIWLTPPEKDSSPIFFGARVNNQFPFGPFAFGAYWIDTQAHLNEYQYGLAMWEERYEK